MESWVTMGNLMISGGVNITNNYAYFDLPLEGSYENELEYIGYYENELEYEGEYKNE